eukprot:gene18891-26749_t
MISTITINAYYPSKLPSLFLRGDNCGLSWDKGLEMTHSISSTGNLWSTEISCDSESKKQLELKVLIQDKDFMLGANHHVIISESNSSEVIYPWFHTYSGSLITKTKIYSSTLNNFRDVILYLPPSYNENTLKRYKNVLVMHDGQNLFDPRTSAFGTAWMCQDTMNNLIISGNSDEVVIIGAYNTADRIDEYTYVYDPSEGAGGKGDLYLDWIESTLLPLATNNFRIDIQRETLGIL